MRCFWFDDANSLFPVTVWRQCMLYASSDDALFDSRRPSQRLGRHKALVRHVSAHLTASELDYFRKWDRLIEFEKHATSRGALSEPWLCQASEKEVADGKCISSLVIDGSQPPVARSETDNDATMRFQRSEDCPHHTPLRELRFDVGTPVIVSEDGASFVPRSSRATRPGRGMVMLHISRGIVTRIGDADIDVSIPHNDARLLVRATRPQHRGVNQDKKKVTFRLDKDEYRDSCKMLHRNLVDFFVKVSVTLAFICPRCGPCAIDSSVSFRLLIRQDIPRSLGNTQSLPVPGERASADHRRLLASSIVQLQPPPRFEHVSEQSLFAQSVQGIPGCDAASLKRDFCSLNVDQKAAVRKVIAARDFALIEGFPGTGKSATISLVTRMLVSRGKRVLVTSYTHSAVDNILTKLMDGGMTPSLASTWSPVLRIAREASCSPNVRPILAETVACEAERTASSNNCASTIVRPRVDFLENAVTAAKVVGVTALTAPRSPLLARQHFDVVIVDEAGQISQPAVLGAIMAADSFVLVGDHMQVSGGLNPGPCRGASFCFRPREGHAHSPPSS